MEQVTKDVLQDFLKKLGERIVSPMSFYLIGGSALILLGATRETIDVDYLVEDLDKNTQNAIQELSDELQLDVEFVPLDEFVPLPAQAKLRHQFIGRYGKVSAFVFDPYSIALSKLDHGFEADLEDIIFLIRRGLVSLSQLEQIVKDAIPQARQFDMNPRELQSHLQTVREELENH